MRNSDESGKKPIEEMESVRLHKAKLESISRDEDKRKRPKEALRESETRLRSFLDSATDGLLVFDSRLNLTDVNKAALEALGVNKRDMIGKNVLEISPDVKTTGRYDKYLEVLRTGKPCFIDDMVPHPKFRDRHLSLRVFKVGDGLGIIGTDITERKKIEKQLQNERDKAQKYLDVAGVMFVAIDDEQRVGLINKKGCEILGYNEEEVIAKNWFDNFLPEKVREQVKAVHEKIVHGEINSLEYYENPILTKDGQERLIAWHNTILRDDKGRFIATLSSGEDITERKKAEEALKETEIYLRTVLSSAPITIFAIDNKGIFTLSEGKGLEKVGLKPNENVGVSALDLYGTLSFTEDNGRVTTGKDIIQRVFAGETIDAIDELSGVYFDNIIAPMRDAEGKIVGIVGVATNITERKKAEEALKKAENEKATILNTMSELVVYQDAEHKIVWANRAACESVGLTTEKLLGRYCYEIWQGRNKPCENCPVEKAWKTGRLEMEEIHSSNGRVWYIRANPVKNKASGVIGVVEISLDITKRKKAEQKLLDYQMQLKSLASELTLAEERERRHIADELHDQISQSLVSSKIELDALRHSVSPRKSDQILKEVSDSLGKAIDDMRFLTFDLSFPILYELGFEAAVAAWLVDQIQEKHGIATEFEEDKQLKPLDDNIRVLLFRTVRELLFNVVKHAHAKKVKVSISKVGSEMYVCVEDDGRGFDREKVAATEAKKGGFGLFSIRERLEQFGGHLEIESAPGCGTKATLIVPLKQKKNE